MQGRAAGGDQRRSKGAFSLKFVKIYSSYKDIPVPSIVPSGEPLLLFLPVA
jgi:hypothetical protein